MVVPLADVRLRRAHRAACWCTGWSRLDPLYNFLLTFGLTLLLVDLVKRRYGVSGLPYERPAVLAGRIEVLGVSLPTYQLFVVAFSVVRVRPRLAGA